MAFLVTTTGLQNPVVLIDLGIQLDDPEINRDLNLEFDIETLRASPSIATAMLNGWITVLDSQGNVLTDPNDLDQVGVEHELGSHKHVDVTGLADKHVLVYDLGTTTWKVGLVAAGDVTYDNSTSLITATDVQAAIDEIEARVDMADDYAGKFELAAISTTEIPNGKWGWWWDTVNLKLFNVRNRSGVLYAVEANPL